MALHQLQQVSGVHRIGPRTDPCGTPYRTADGVEQAADVRTVKPRIVAGSRIQAGPRIQAGGSSELYQ